MKNLQQATFILSNKFYLGAKPLKMVIIPPSHFCLIENPVKRNKDGQLINDKFG